MRRTMTLPYRWPTALAALTAVSLLTALAAAQPRASGSGRYRDPRYDPRAEGIPSGPPSLLAPRPTAGGSLSGVHATALDARYLSPIGLAVSGDGAELYVSCENTDQLLVVEAPVVEYDWPDNADEIRDELGVDADSWIHPYEER